MVDFRFCSTAKSSVTLSEEAVGRRVGGSCPGSSSVLSNAWQFLDGSCHDADPCRGPDTKLLLIKNKCLPPKFIHTSAKTPRRAASMPKLRAKEQFNAKRQ
jgi:hypothetical protein